MSFVFAHPQRRCFGQVPLLVISHQTGPISCGTKSLDAQRAYRPPIPYRGLAFFGAVEDKLGTAELSVIEGSRGGDKPWGLLAFFIFAFFRGRTEKRLLLPCGLSTGTQLIENDDVSIFPAHFSSTWLWAARSGAQDEIQEVTRSGRRPVLPSLSQRGRSHRPRLRALRCLLLYLRPQCLQ